MDHVKIIWIIVKLNIFHRGYVKWKVFMPTPATLDELEQKIKDVISSIPEEMIRKACGDLLRRAHLVLRNNGGYIEWGGDGSTRIGSGEEIISLFCYHAFLVNQFCCTVLISILNVETKWNLKGFEAYEEVHFVYIMVLDGFHNINSIYITEKMAFKWPLHFFGRTL